MTTRVAVVGATGRMGALVSRLIEESPDFTLSAKLGSRDPLSAMLGADVVVDVSLPAVSPVVVDFAIENGLSVLVGTSGWTSERVERVASTLASAPDVGVIFVPNFSLGSVLATRFSSIAARFFESMEIVEAHGATKIDSPSGTALRTAELMYAERASAGSGLVAAPHADQRARGQQVSGIPIHSIRLQGVVAKQDVLLGGPGEVLTISHETLAPTAYESGIMLALRALTETSGVVVGLDELLGLDAVLRTQGTSANAGGAS